ncbi:MAG: T9SS type A sorting domain-containing protein [Flavobacteriales bacterium]|nr:T9SS type A sorting domain-containing protein [Flavobacteriales bacterium]
MHGTGSITLLAFGLFWSAGEASGQCTLYISDEMPGVCSGMLYLGGCSGTWPDSVVWSNGDVGVCQGPPGVYTYQAWLNGAVMQAGNGSINSVEWELDLQFAGLSQNFVYGMVAGLDIQSCSFSGTIGPCCVPQTDTEVYLVQDSVNLIQDPCIGCHDHWCAPGSLAFFPIPCGHTYWVRLVDSACVGQVDFTQQSFIAHNNANLILDTAVTGSVPGFNTGSVELIEAVPDTTELYPIYGPVTGTAVLYEGLNGSSIVAQYSGVTDAIWTGLDTGYYRVCFAPDSGCQVICDTLYVPAVPGNGVDESANMDALSLVPTATTGMLTLRSRNGSAFADITITDALGREVMRMRIAPGPFSVAQLPRGAYVLNAVQGSERLRVRFLKE